MQDSVPHNASQKQCAKCHLWLPFSDYSLCRRNKGGLYYHCKKCDSAYCKKTRTPEKKRNSALRNSYGITVRTYNRMFAEQSGVCAVCKKPETYRNGHSSGGIRHLAVDHDHKTGVPRALLCHKCNTALAYMNEEPERINSLKAYAEWCQSHTSGKIVQLRLGE